MRAAFLDLLGVAGLALVTWALWEVDTRIARSFLGASMISIALVGAWLQAKR